MIPTGWLRRAAPMCCRLWWAMRSLLVAALCGFVCIAATFPGDRLVYFEHLEDLFGPPKDYLPDQQKFVNDGDYSSAITLGDFVREHPDLPHAAEIVALRDSTEADYNSWLSRSKRAASGFLTGNADSPQGMAGDVAANFLVYGNIRDLAKEGYHKATGAPVDSFLVALSAAGLAADIATYFPPTTEGGAPAEAGFSLLKALKRAGAMTAEFTAKILDLAKGAKTVERMKELASCTLDTIKLYRRVPAGAIGCVMRTVKSGDELAKVVKVAEEAPKEVALICKFGEAEGIAVLKTEKPSKQALTEFLKFGRRTTVKLLRPTHVAVGLIKNLKAGRLSYFLHNVLPNNVRFALAWISGLSAVLAVSNAVRHCRWAFIRRSASGKKAEVIQV